MQSTGDMVFSGMKFKDFGTDSCFRIEESILYKTSLQHLGFKTVEFVAFHPTDDATEGKLIFVEARTTLRPENTGFKFSNEINEELAKKEKLVLAGDTP